MRTSKAWILAVLLALCVGGASAEEQFSGTVVAGETLSVAAPFGGTIKSIGLREGALLGLGDTVATLETTKVLASEDGTIRGVSAEPGDSAEQTVLYLSPVSRYTVSASVSKAYSKAENKYVRIGETLYLKCAADGSHKAVGVVTSVDGSGYTVQTTAGELYMEETVYLYRSESYAASARVGSGTVSRTDEIAVAGTGSLLKLYVADGDEVERGQLLFETVEGTLDGLMADGGGEIVSGVSGVVAAVNASAGQKVSKGDVLLTVYPTDSYQIELSIPEDLLASVSAGAQATVYFDWDEDKSHRCVGTVTDISYVAETSESGETTYAGYVAFTADDTVRLGMNVTVTIE